MKDPKKQSLYSVENSMNSIVLGSNFKATGNNSFTMGPGVGRNINGKIYYDDRTIKDIIEQEFKNTNKSWLRRMWEKISLF